MSSEHGKNEHHKKSKITKIKKITFESSPSSPGGNQVDGLPPPLSWKFHGFFISSIFPHVCSFSGFCLLFFNIFWSHMISLFRSILETFDNKCVLLRSALNVLAKSQNLLQNWKETHPTVRTRISLKIETLLLYEPCRL